MPFPATAPGGRALTPDDLMAACGAPGVPGLVPHAAQSLAAVSGQVLAALDAADRGVVVLGVDGLGWEVAASTWRAPRLTCLTSTFPSTSVTAWTTALTGAPPEAHLAVGMAYRLPLLDEVVHVVADRQISFAGAPHPDRRQSRRPRPRGPSPAAGASAASGGGGTGLLRPLPTLFERAVALGHGCVAIGRELDTLTGPWVPAILRGAARMPTGGRAGLPASRDPAAIAADAAAQVSAVLDGRAGTVPGIAAAGAPAPRLVWAYVNLDDHVHLHGYDAASRRALAALETAALAWASRGWTVLAHGDHGQTARVRAPALEAAWARLDDPRWCRLPGGGAGRVRWLYPLPGRAELVATELRHGLGEHALVVTVDELAGLGLVGDAGAVRGRVGEVVAVAASPAFPAPDPAVRFEHGAVTPEELLVPLATWPAGGG